MLEPSIPTEPARLNVRSSRVSTVFVHQVPADRGEQFLQWQRRISTAVESFPGYQGTDAYPPIAGEHKEWVAVVHFDGDEHLQVWLKSPVRAELVAQAEKEFGAFWLQTLSSGFAPWFLDRAGKEAPRIPPGWKMVLTVLLGLYPTVMLLTLGVAPWTDPLGMAISMLIGNILSVVLLQYAVMPLLLVVLGPWLQAPPGSGVRLTWLGLAAVVLSLGLITMGFWLFTR